MPYVYPACPSTPSHTPTASQYKSFRSIPSNKAYKNTNKYFNQNSSSRPDYEQYATTSLSVLLKPRTNFEKSDETDLETRLQVRKQSYILCLLMHLEKKKLFRVKESVYFQKLVKYSTRSESHPSSSTDYVLHMYCTCDDENERKWKKVKTNVKPM